MSKTKIRDQLTMVVNCPNCGGMCETLIVFPMPHQMSGSYYCWSCQIYVTENGEEDRELMAIMLEVLAEEEMELEV